MKSRRTPVRKPRLQFETLESRLPLAGNVTVAVTGLSIKITGDDLENQIAIGFEDIDDVEMLVVTGLDGTTVTGGEIPLPDNDDGAFKNLTIDLKKANTAAGDPRGTLGADRIEIDDLFITGNLSITGKNGGVVEMVESEVVGTTKITFGNGLSEPGVGTQIKITECGLGLIQEDGGSGKNVTITTGANADTVVITHTPMGKDVAINLKNGNNTLAILAERFEGDEEFPFDSSGFIDGKLTVTGGDGNDCVGLVGVVVQKNLKISTGKGDDFAGAADLAVLGATSVTSTDGNDIAAIGLRDAEGNTLPAGGLGNALIGHVTVTMGNGDDLVAAQGTMFGRVEVVNGKDKEFGGKFKLNLGAGNDRLVETENDFQIGALEALIGIRGGAGADSIISDLSPLDATQLKFVQFENQPFLDNAFIEDLISDIFNEVADCFGEILLEFGIDIGGGSGGGDDPNDTLDEAFDSLSDVVPSVDDEIDSPTDVDIYKILTVGPGETISVDVIPNSGTLNAVLQLFDENGNPVGISDTGLAGDAEHAEFTNDSGSAVSVFAAVSSSANSQYDVFDGSGDADGASTGEYTIQLGAGGDEDDQISEAIELLVGEGPIDDSIDNIFDVDMFSFGLNPGDTGRIVVSTTTPDLDIVLRLFDNSGQEFGTIDAGLGGVTETFEFTNDFPTVLGLFVSVSSFGNVSFDPLEGTNDTAADATGDFSISVSLVQD